jgi:hypothetical protein
MLKTLWILLTSIGVGVAQLSWDDMADPEKVSAWERGINVDSIGCRTKILKEISRGRYIITGTLFYDIENKRTPKTFIAIQNLGDRENDNYCITKKRITQSQLQHMTSIVYINAGDIPKVLNGGKANVEVLCGSVNSGFENIEGSVQYDSKIKWLNVDTYIK